MSEVASPKKKTSIGVWIVGFFMLIGVLVAVALNSDPPPQPETKSKADLERDAAITADMQRAGGAVLASKKALRDPATFELTNAFVTSEGAACIEYFGRNAFNARMPNMSVVTKDGKVQATGDGNAVVNAWNKHCARKTGANYTEIIQKVVLK